MERFTRLAIALSTPPMEVRPVLDGELIIRWRPDKAPQQCRLDQLASELRPARLDALLREEA